MEGVCEYCGRRVYAGPMWHKGRGGPWFCCEEHCKKYYGKDSESQERQRLAELEKERIETLERQERERQEEQAGLRSYTLHCDQCGRELSAVRFLFAWNYPKHWNAQGKQTEIYTNDCDLWYTDGIGCYCSNGCYEAAKASGLTARQLREHSATITCPCGKSYLSAEGYRVDFYQYSGFFCSRDCAVKFVNSFTVCNPPKCNNKLNVHKVWFFNYKPYDNQSIWVTWAACSQSCAEQARKDIANSHKKDEFWSEEVSKAEIYGPVDLMERIIPQPLEKSSSFSGSPAAASVAGVNVDDDADIFLVPEEHTAPKAAVDYRSGDSSKLSFLNCSYSVSDSKCTIKAERIDNDSSWRTGNIKLSLWFCKEPYNSGTINGTCMATTDWLGQLKEGYGFTDINKKLKITGSADPGKYNAVVTAQEKHESGKNNIVGWVNFDKPVYWKIADPTLAVESRSGAPSSLSIGGADFVWSKVEGTERTFSFNFALKDIKNLSEWGTGKLFVDMWFCNEPYSDGIINGTQVFNSLPVSFDGGGSGIAGEESKTRAVFQTTLEQDSSPATGRYHVLFVLTEQNTDGDKKQVAYYNFEQPTDWKGLAMAPDGQMSSVTLQDCKYAIKAGRLSITPSLANGSDWLTRQLSLDFYLCKTAGYSGGDVAGTLMASVSLGTLYPGSSGGGEHTVNITGKLKRGQYRALAVLCEDNGNGEKVPLSWKEFPQPQVW